MLRRKIGFIFPIIILGAFLTFGKLFATKEGLFTFQNIDQLAKLDTLENRLARIQTNQNTIIEDQIRQGFPYCEPFTGTKEEREQTEIGGDAVLTADPGLNNGVLQLTTTNPRDQVGYAFIDLPFLSTYGIKVSFEYYSYDDRGGNEPGDGLSFFLYDGSIEKSQFKIGGLGGSLGYSAHGYSSPGFSGDPISGQGYGGLLGGYMGIGIDIKGAFGNEYERRYGGFLDPTRYFLSYPSSTNRPEFPQSVVIRGPHRQITDPQRKNGNVDNNTMPQPDQDSYRFIDGRITFFDPSDPNADGSSLLDPNQYLIDKPFKLNSNGPILDCAVDGYRKVFIDLSPKNPNNPDEGYKIKVDFLVNRGNGIVPELIKIFGDDGIDFNEPAPRELKLGFAGATGTSKRSIQAIRNVTVQVSNEDQLAIPLTEALEQEVCAGEEDFFELDVTLRNQGAVIQCIQLYYNEAAAEEVGDLLNDIGNEQNCDSGICNIQVCQQERLVRTFPLGILEQDADGYFEAVLVEENGEEVPKVFFRAAPNASGEYKVWYTVTDIFGQISEPQPITIRINPIAESLNTQPNDTYITKNPSCDGQEDGEISNVVFGNLIDSFSEDNFTVLWTPQGSTIPEEVPKSQVSYTPISNGQTSFTVTGVNLGTYEFQVWNPSDISVAGCIDTFLVDVTQEDGTPVLIVNPVTSICEGSSVTYTPEVDQTYIDKVQEDPVILWYSDPNRSNPINPGLNETGQVNIRDRAGNEIPDISFSVDANGVLTLDGLPANGNQGREYEFFVEVADFENPSGANFCFTKGQMRSVVLTVGPSVFFETEKVSDDVCLDDGGSILVSNLTGGDGNYFLELLDESGNTIQSQPNVAGTGYTFTGISKGEYSVRVSSGNPICIKESDPITVDGPDQALSITQLDQSNPSCGLENGIVTFEVAGGTPDANGDYSFTLNSTGVSPNESGGTYSISGLAPNTSYTITVSDENGCTDSFDITLPDTPIPSFDLDDAVICPDETAVLTPVIPAPGNPSNVNPSDIIYNWETGTGDPITNGTNNGVTYVIDPANGSLSISGLPENTQAYEYFLIITGPFTCNPAPIRATVTVNPIPKIQDVQQVDILCFGESTGSITFIPEDATAGADYEYKLDKEATSWQGAVFNNLPAGTYSPEVRNTNTGCTTTLPDVTLTEPAEVLFDFDEVIQPACGEANGLIRVNFSGGVGPYEVALFQNGSSIRTESNASSPLEFRDLAPGDYEIRLTDDNGCPHTLNQQLINDVGIQISVDPMSDEICAGDVATILPVITTAGEPELTWYKSPNQQNPITTNATPDPDGLTFVVDASTMQLEVTGLQPGTYTYYLVAEGPGYCPNPPFEANITVLEPITATLAIENEACFGAGDGSIKVSASGSDGNFEYRRDGDGGNTWQSSNLFSNLAPGIYTIDVRSIGGNDCVFSVSGEVLGTTPIAINAPDIFRSSCGLANGSIENLQISGGWGNYSVEWRQGSETGPVVSTDPTQAIDLAPDTYFLLITDAEGCLFVESFVLEEQPRPNFVIAPVEICAGEEVILTPVNTVSGSSGSELVWYKDASRTQEISNGPDAIDPSVSYSIDADGTLTITGLEGDRDPYIYYLHVVCNDENVSVEALVRTVPALDFETDPEQCFGAEDGKIRIIAGADPLYEYSISGNNLTQAELEAAEYAPGTYIISVSNEGFCLQDFTVVVEGPDAPLEVDPLTQIDPGCGADIGVISTEVSGGWAPYEVTLFRDGSAIETSTFQGPEVEFDDLAPGDYYLTVTDAEGCVETSNTVTLVYGPTQIIIDDVGICEGKDAVLIPSINPSAPNPTYSWFKDAAATIPIVSDPNPDANGHIFQISANGILTISGLDASDSPQTYYATVSGTDVCPDFIGSAQVVINRIPSLSYTVSNEVCFGDNGTINLQGSAGDGTFEYSLNGINWQSSGTFDVAPGIYTGYVRSGAGCIVSSPNIEVQGPSAPLSYSEPALVDPTCNTPDGSISFTISGGYGNYSVEVTKDGASFGTFASPSGQVDLQDLESGSYSFLILDENPDGINCQLSIPAQIELEDLPTPLSASGVEICEGETANIQASTTQTGISPVFTWYQNANGTGEINTGTSGSVSYQVNSSTGELSISGLSGQSDPYVYYVGISGNGVCEPELVPVEVFVYPIPNLRVSNPSIVCDPQGTVDLTQFIEGFNPNIYDYNIIDPTGGSMRMDEIDAVNLTGSYQVSTSLRGADCWSAEQRIQVIISDTELIPEFNYEVDLGGGNILTNAEVQIQEPVQFQDVSLGKVIIWNWNFGDGSTSSEQNPSHEYQKKGSYTVTLTTIDEFGCVAEYQRVIQVFDDYIIMVPNAFTPDGTKNQYFKPQYRGIASMEFYIFNTWGELIFEANSLETMGWDGTLNGKKVPNGNYVYRAVFTTRSGEKEERSGVFVLIR
ncbi:PKD domain-containing protein [uncultured Algoriphagus sp.]|uniref:PKD domain-containing protein n=1 Tax=uncultured Algoriphagus sp. TaxID=417365 RepID=UPI0025847FC1|nr:PKD domain-containing protein [uncultured Algoriphagus sp.]